VFTRETAAIAIVLRAQWVQSCPGFQKRYNTIIETRKTQGTWRHYYIYAACIMVVNININSLWIDPKTGTDSEAIQLMLAWTGRKAPETRTRARNTGIKRAYDIIDKLSLADLGHSRVQMGPQCKVCMWFLSHSSFMLPRPPGPGLWRSQASILVKNLEFCSIHHVAAEIWIEAEDSVDSGWIVSLNLVAFSGWIRCRFHDVTCHVPSPSSKFSVVLTFFGANLLNLVVTVPYRRITTLCSWGCDALPQMFIIP